LGATVKRREGNGRHEPAPESTPQEDDVSARLEGKVAIVTGAGSGGPDAGLGIGQAIAMTMARDGASVLILDRDAARADATLSCIEEQDGPASTFIGDITSSAVCEAAVRTAVERYGGLDILVNNAAIAEHKPITETDEDLYDQTLDINLKGTFLACKHAVPALLARGGGSIINIGSVAGIRDAGTGQTAYAASKAGQIGLTIELAGSYGRENIRVNAVLPGLIATPMMKASGRADDLRARLNLLGRFGEAWDVASTVVFLCSDQAAYITGVVLPVDGGATIGMPASAFRKSSGDDA
jgi:NAD(P)-dependent dehydrogenase (short-subunit alcohol dehydrogenase family)